MSVSPASTSVRTARLDTLPLVALHLTDRCNSRCVTCDYWRHGHSDVTVETIVHLLPQLTRLGTRDVLVSGGEPLIHPQWREIAQLLRDRGIDLWLLTAGLSLAKHARSVAGLFRSVTVSLDGADRRTYAAIRGLDAFDNVCAGVRALVETGTPVGIRTTVQRGNYRQLPALVSLAHQLGAAQISFLAADVKSLHAFGRVADFAVDVALQSEDLSVFSEVLRELEREYAAAFQQGFIAESPEKLWRLRTYYAALCHRGAYPPVRCNAPEYSAVIDVTGRVDPCFFIAGPSSDASLELPERLNSAAMTALRTAIRERRRPECETCVCSIWRDPQEPVVPALDVAKRTRPSVQHA